MKFPYKLAGAKIIPALIAIKGTSSKIVTVLMDNGTLLRGRHTVSCVCWVHFAITPTMLTGMTINVIILFIRG